MTERKPPGVEWQSWIDRQIEEGRARGAFDGLPGTGKPIAGLDRPRDEMWWVRDKLKREGVEYLPPSLAIRREADRARERALRAPSEAEARRILEEVNGHIRYLNSHMCEGPATTVMPLDVDGLLAERRAHRDRYRESTAAAPAPAPGPRRPQRPRLRRLFPRRRKGACTARRA